MFKSIEEFVGNTPLVKLKRLPGNPGIALAMAAETENAVIVSILRDRGDRYLSTGVFPA